MASMIRTGTQGLVLSAVAGAAIAGGPVIEIPPEALPGESYFAANPGATVNINAGGSILAGEMMDPFGFNGATVNIFSGGEAGFAITDQFIEDVAVMVEGGLLQRTKFIGSVGTTSCFLVSGSCERGIWLMGNTIMYQDGGSIGVVAGGQAALIAEDDSYFEMTEGTIDTFVSFNDDSEFVMSGGTISGALQLNDDAVATMSAGLIGADGFMKGLGNVFDFSGGITGDAFVVEKGIINISGGTLGENSALLNGAGVDPVLNMTSGAIGDRFRAYDGTLNISGGVIGGEFRLGTPTGDGSGVTLNLIVKSAMLDGSPLTLSATPTTITARGGLELSCVMLDDSVNVLTLNESSVFGEDRIRAGAVLTVALDCPADFTGDGEADFFDVSFFLSNMIDYDMNGVFDFFDLSMFLGDVAVGCP
jgi:hypothetical protein